MIDTFMRTKRAASAPVHIAIVGLGSIAVKHLKTIKALFPDWRVTVVRSQSRTIEPNLRPLVSEVILMSELASYVTKVHLDGAIVATPATVRLDVLEVLAPCCAAVLIEKPLAHSGAVARQCETLERRTGCTFLVGYQLRHHEGYALMQQRIDEGAIGKVIQAHFECGSMLSHWRPTIGVEDMVSGRRDLGGGVLRELSHEIDLANTLFGPLECSYAQMANSQTFQIDVEDVAKIQFCNASGLLLSCHIDFCSVETRRFSVVHGQQGSLGWNVLAGEFIETDCNGDQQVTVVEKGTAGCFEAQLRHFANCISRTEVPLVSTQGARIVCEMIDDIQDRCSYGGKVK